MPYENKFLEIISQQDNLIEELNEHMQNFAQQLHCEIDKVECLKEENALLKDTIRAFIAALELKEE